MVPGGCSVMAGHCGEEKEGMDKNQVGLWESEVVAGR